MDKKNHALRKNYLKPGVLLTTARALPHTDNQVKRHAFLGAFVIHLRLL